MPETPVLGFAAFSGVGKTTLLTQLIPLLGESGIQIALIKHAHHNFDIDQPGKDSYELRKAGANQVLITSSARWALMTETPARPEASLQAALSHIDHERVDLILVEGFRHEPFPKIELHRTGLQHPLLCLEDSHIIALATDVELDIPVSIPQLNINNPAQIAGFICRELLDRSYTPSA